ncbi:hypothetical protein BC826DRAFT_989455 [Russula brevipes]|nr:hypothetical protein BC826DRAFT_989455 [Russula brevipes]
MAIERVSVAAGSTSRTRQKPIRVTETPTNHKDKSKAEERGAGELAALNTHEVYPRFLLGPSVHGSTITTVQGAPPRVAGSEQGATWHYVGGTVEQQPEAGDEAEHGRPEATGKDHFQIPRRLGRVYKALLEASTEDWTRGTVRVLKCRLCPSADFGNWADFKRHCRFSEARPYEIVFCYSCGDFFARQDALDRHRKKPPRAMAAFKRKVTEVVYRLFLERLERCLKTKEDIGTPFAQVIQGTFPGSSKRGSRPQSRLGASTSQSRSPESVSTDWM